MVRFPPVPARILMRDSYSPDCIAFTESLVAVGLLKLKRIALRVPSISLSAKWQNFVVYRDLQTVRKAFCLGNVLRVCDVVKGFERSRLKCSGF